MTKKVLFLLLLTMMTDCLNIFSQSDLILCLDGTAIKGTVTLVTDEQVQYRSNQTNRYLGRKDVYMIKFEGHRNLFPLRNGTLSFDNVDEEGKTPDDAVYIYMVWGQELMVSRAEVQGHEVVYETYEKKKRQQHALPQKDVFMVRYPNGTDIMVTPLDNFQVKTAVPSKEQLLPVVLPVDTKLLKKTRPADASLILQNGNTINATIVGGNEQAIIFYRKEDPKGPVYQLQRSQIESIEYKTSKKTRTRR